MFIPSVVLCVSCTRARKAFANVHISYEMTNIIFSFLSFCNDFIPFNTHKVKKW